MTTYVIIAAVVGGVGLLLTLLIRGLISSSREAGALKERNVEQAKADVAKDKANEVLAERRDPDDAVKRLRDGDF